MDSDGWRLSGEDMDYGVLIRVYPSIKGNIRNEIKILLIVSLVLQVMK